MWDIKNNVQEKDKFIGRSSYLRGRREKAKTSDDFERFHQMIVLGSDRHKITGFFPPAATETARPSLTGARTATTGVVRSSMRRTPTT